MADLAIDRALDESDEIIENLRVGSAPLPRAHKGGTLVLCAKEYQLGADQFPGAEVIHAPFDDANRPMLSEEIATATRAAHRVAKRLHEGTPVLVTCFAGWNRSALVAGLAMIEVRSYSVKEVLLLIRAARGPNALSNPYFVSLLGTFGDILKSRK